MKLLSSDNEVIDEAFIAADGSRVLIEWIEPASRRSRTSLHDLPPP